MLTALFMLTSYTILHLNLAGQPLGQLDVCLSRHALQLPLFSLLSHIFGSKRLSYT